LPGLSIRLLEFSGPALAGIVIIQRAMGHVAFPYNENATASLLLLLFPWHWGRHWMLAWFTLAGLACTGSYGAILAAVGAVAILIAVSYQKERHMPWYSWAFVILGAIIIAGVIIAALQPATTIARLAHWEAAWDLWQRRVWVGWGPGSYLTVSPIPDQNHADNLWLTVGAEMGSLGFALVGTLTVYTLWHIFTTAGNPARMALLAWLMHQVVDCTLFFPLVGALVAINMAFLWREHATDTGNGIPSHARRMGSLSGSFAEPK